MIEEKDLSFCKGVCKTLVKFRFNDASLTEPGILLDGKKDVLKKLLEDPAYCFALMPYAELKHCPKKYQTVVGHPAFNLVRQYLKKEKAESLYREALAREWNFPEFEAYLFQLLGVVSDGGGSEALYLAEARFLTALKERFYPGLLYEAFLIIVLFFDDILDKDAAKNAFREQKFSLQQQVRHMFYSSAACGF